ncbi:CLUMA_CG012284, isoform A [Clunio marinus]|uniref:CLUMA_CG012284, isoform A n=1 Tax=Clunio marinus TaxID=568069 RepID=A0A1J1IFS5_9DIPT|nr:CLUMA_CG012284, isoform A [Clunio marinus]
MNADKRMTIKLNNHLVENQSGKNVRQIVNNVAFFLRDVRFTMEMFNELEALRKFNERTISDMNTKRTNCLLIELDKRSKQLHNVSTFSY